MIINFVRHGLTQGNLERRYVGATDVPLAPEGLRRAQEAKGDKTLKKVYVTPLMRTHQTAGALYPNAQQHEVLGLREMNFGIFEGFTYEELAQNPAFSAWNTDGGMQPMEGGEGRSDFAVRVGEALTQLIKDADQRGEEEITIVCHGGVIMALMALYARPEQGYTEYWTDNLQGYRVTLNPATWTAQSHFDTWERLDLNQ